MKLIISLILICILLSLNTLTIAGIDLDDQLTIDQTDLVLNGAGLRKKIFLKIYALALYLTEKWEDSEEIITSDHPMAIRMVFLYRKVPKEKLIAAWNDGFSQAKELDSLALEIAKFNSLFTSDAQKGDVYDFVYHPRKGTDVYFNGKWIETVGGLAFKRALFSIWLAESTSFPKLREKLLGL